MKVTLRTSSTSLGNKGDTVTVGKSLASGLIRKGWAEKAKSGLDDKTVSELQAIARQRGVAYAGLRKADLIKELKQVGTTKEHKGAYQTK